MRHRTPTNPHATDAELKYASQRRHSDLRSSVVLIADRLESGEISAGQAMDELIEMSIEAEVPEGDLRMRSQVRNMLQDLLEHDPSLAGRANRIRGGDG